MSQREDALKFETGRIKALQEERLHIQKKTFTKWMNSFLAKARMEVEDLFLDLADGKKLLKLLEIISGEKLGKPNTGKMRFHKIENVNKSLAFLHTKVRLESIGAEDIVDGNPRLILGLIWTIILRFQIQEIEIDVDEENESSEKKSAKDALLLWCQRKTNGYKGVNIQDFSGSWRNGLGFNALIHSHRPDLIDFYSLSPHQHIDNLNNAFDVAHRDLGIAKLLDAEDIDTNKPDEKSVMTYIASYYHTFAKMKNEMKGGRRIANILNQMMDIDQQKDDYERLSSDLLNWINEKIAQLEDHNFPNSLDEIQKLLMQFKMYRTEEKPPKYRERSEIEAKLFATQTKLKALGQSVYIPPEGKMVQDIERAWDQLEKAEHTRELALRGELMRQERLEQLAYKFDKKSVLRDGYLKEMTQVLSDPRYGSNLTQIEATVKKHEAISADILARTERFHDLSNMAQELVKEGYHDSDQVNLREKAVMQKWEELLQLLENRKDTLNKHNNVMSIIREMDTVSSQIQTMQDKFSSEDYGRHLLAVEDLLEKHSLLESQIVIQGESIGRLNRQTEQFKRHQEAPVLKNHMQQLHEQFDNLQKLSAQRRNRLEDSRDFYQFLQDHEEEEAWLQEKQRICNAPIVGKDLLAILSLQQKHKALEDEMKARQPKSEQLCQAGESLIAQSHQEANEIKNRINNLRSKWKDLLDLAEGRKKKLDDATETYQYYADANEADSWMNEKLPLVASKDYGKDEPSAQSLLQRHGHLESEIKAYEGDLDRLNEQAAKLVQNGLSSLPLIETSPMPEEDEYIDQVVLVPYEVEVDQIVDREVIQDVIEKRLLPQVRAAFSFTGQGIQMQKGEIMVLLNKTNDDWWSVRKNDNSDGFVPANYLKEMEPKIVRRVVKKPVTVKHTERVKQMRTKEQIVRTKIAPKLSSAKTNIPDQRETDSVQQRQNKINTTYNTLLDLSKSRHKYLEDAIQLFGFFRECDDFKAWMTDKEKILTVEDQNESVEQMKRKFENFLTDLSTSAYRVDAIDEAVAEFGQHQQEREIRRRQKEIHDQWNRLNKLKLAKEKSLEGATSVELFNRTCDEARDWMLEKMNKMDNDELGKDLKTVKALQRKHENVERELAPLEEKYNRVNLLANSVKASYPNEKQNVNARQKQLENLWHDVKDKALNRRARLEQAVGQQIFDNTARNLLLWMSGVKNQLNTDEPIRDVSTAQNALKKHDELKDDLRTHKDEFKELVKLGEGLTKNSPDAIAIVSKLAQLQNEYKSLENGCKEKEDRLKQILKLQMFNREADQIDALTTSHETFLDYDDLGTSTDNIFALLKRHEDFENTLVAQDERVAALEGTADELIKIPHSESRYIENRKKQTANRRRALKDRAADRKQALLASQSYYEFKADADEMISWIQDKKKVASDESYRDLSNLQRKLKKHEVFEGELKANERRLASIDRTGQRLATRLEHRADEINEILEHMRTEWEKLWLFTNDKGRKFRQAVAQHIYNKTLEDAKMKLAEIENALQSTDFGNDLRSVKHLLKKHQMLENDIKVWNTKFDDVIKLGEDMAKDGHFDAPAILKQTHDLKERFKQLQQPAMKRRRQLEKSLKLHQFNFEADGEIQWIAEHVRSTSSTDIGQNLIEAQNILKKHLKLEREVAGHKPVIDKVLTAGNSLIEENHYASKEIENKSTEIMNAWDNLFELAKDRKKRLEVSLRTQQFFSEANEVESWLNEKKEILSNQDYGRDEDATIKLLTKHKTLELEMDSYSGLITEMGCQAAKMIANKHPDSTLIQQKQEFIDQEMQKLQEMANVRRQLLIESKHKHEYCRESDNLENWIEEQIQIALSEEYGQDYEHLLLLQSKFDDFKYRVEASTEQFIQQDELATKLIDNRSIFADEIENKQLKLRELWESLLEHIQAREQKLHAAEEIHRFNRDIAEAIQRMQDKDASISDDLGRDLNSVLSLLRKHEGFENDLVAIEAQLQVLIDDSSRLQIAYPGGNAEHIQLQQDVMLEHWNSLKDRSLQRKDQLKHSCDFQRFLASVRDLIGWANTLHTAMMAEERVRDAASAQLLKTDHERLKAEIEAREESFTAVVHNGEYMIKNSHYAANEIRNKLAQLLDSRQKLHSTWQHKKIYLDQLIDLHFFLRDAKQLDAMSATQEAFLTSGDYDNSVEEVESQVRKHEAFEKVLCTQDDKLVALQTHGSKLIEQNHFDAQNIKKRLDDVTARRKRVRDLCANEKIKLMDALLYAQFNRDVSEAEIAIEEKQKKLDSEIESADPADLEEKINRLQKHQAFQSELTAHEGKIKDIKQNGNTLLHKRHHESVNIRQKLQHLLQMWSKLLTESNNRGRGLEEAQDILQFNNHVEKVEAWIREKDMMVQAGDNGRDYEHCLALQRKLDDVDSDMQVDEARIVEINNLADKLMCQGPSDTRSVQARKDELNQKWKALQGAIHEYRERLAAALEVHAFNRDVDDTKDRINEKMLAMSTEDCGKNLPAVETLQRKQETLERDMTAIEMKLKEHDTEARRLIQKYVEAATPIRNKLSLVQDSWRNLTNRCHVRKQLLASSYTFQKFMAEMKELELWVGDMISRMNSNQLPKEVVEAENFLQLHQERKAEIDGRQDSFKTLKLFGYRLIQQNHSAKDELEDCLSQLEELRRTLIQAWEERKQILTQCLDLQLFYEHVELAHAWLASKEALLNNEDLGDSMSSVEALIRKHETFEKTVQVQNNKIDRLEKFSTELIAGKHYASTEIQSNLHAICERRDRLKELAMIRRRKLLESKQLQQFLRNNYEVLGWIQSKMTVACDENYRESSNLQRKIQKHQVFEAELAANKSRVNNVNNEGEGLIGAGHFAGMEIQTQLDELESKWRQLMDMSQLKKERLDDAYQAYLFNRLLEDLETWMDEMETLLQSEDHGKDLISVQNLLKKHQALETDVNNHADNIETVKDATQTFANNNNFMGAQLQDKAQAIIERYSLLHEPVQIRRDNLEDALLLYQFYRDVDDEMSWIAEKESLASSTDLGSSLTAVQNLQKKHQVLEAEIQTHEPLVVAVSTMVQQMMRNSHFASAAIESRGQELQVKWQQLKDQTTVRRLRLLDAVESQLFYSDANEMEIWIKDRLLLLNSQDLGKDEDSAQILLKKMDALERDVEAFSNNIIQLYKVKQKLTERGHFDSHNIEAKQMEVEAQYAQLKQAAENRRKLLNDNKKLLKYLREVDEVMETLSEHMLVANVEDYGRDLEHVEILIKKFERFVTSLMPTDERVLAMKTQGDTLIEEGCREKDFIRNRIKELLQMREDLKDQVNLRQEALLGAKQVHELDRNADETISWIQEKDQLISNDDFGHDLESIQMLIRKHEGFERDLAAIKERVESVVKEAHHLAEIFPDARTHVGSRHEETVDAWNRLLDKSAQRKDKLQQAEELQAYFDEYRDLMAWLSEMMAKLTASTLAQDVRGAELLLARHQEHRAEIDSRLDVFAQFTRTGEILISQGHFMADEIVEKIGRLDSALKLLLTTWQERQFLYEENLDTQMFKRDADALDSWLEGRAELLRATELGDSISQVEDLLRKHDDFEKTVEAQDEKFAALKRITLLEQHFHAQQAKEAEQRKMEAQRREQERINAMKRKEHDRILNERKREDERRRTTEIRFGKDQIAVNGDGNSFNSSSDRLSRFPSVESLTSSQGLSSKKLSSVEMPEIKPLNLSNAQRNNEYGSDTNVRRGESMRVDKLGVPVVQVKRSESMKLDEQQTKTKRTPSFTTKRRSQSFRKNKKGMDAPRNLPPVEMEGFTDRKQELQSGGKRATIRSWKTLYSVLCGQLLCFFKDKDDFIENKAASPPLGIHQAKCSRAQDYTKKKFVFRLQPADGAEYLFTVDSAEAMSEWINKINFHANLPPRMQLLSYRGETAADAVVLAQEQQLAATTPAQPIYVNFPLDLNMIPENESKSKVQSDGKQKSSPVPLRENVKHQNLAPPLPSPPLPHPLSTSSPAVFSHMSADSAFVEWYEPSNITMSQSRSRATGKNPFDSSDDESAQDESQVVSGHRSLPPGSMPPSDIIIRPHGASTLDSRPLSDTTDIDSGIERKGKDKKGVFQRLFKKN